MDEQKVNSKVPFSLYQHCLNFVADHVVIVDSFSGFPSQIGEQIFNLCLSKKKFMDNNLTALTLFTSEFEDEVLNSLNLSGEYLCLNYYLEQFLLFTSLRELDVSYCGLGDDHEVLTQFTQISSLEVLNLQGNSLSTAGIQRMTTPYRMLGKGPRHLRLMNISGNSEVSINVLKYLSPFKSLTVILSDVLPKKTSEYSNWDIKTDKSLEVCCIGTKGWASDLIEEWKIKVKSKKSNYVKKKTFYTTPQHIPCYKPNCKQQDLKIVVAINKASDKQKQVNDIPQVVTKTNYSEADKQALFDIYSHTLTNNTEVTENNQSVLDLIDRNSSSCKNNYQHSHCKSQTKFNNMLKKIPPVTSRYECKAKQLTKNCDSKTIKINPKKKFGSITQYFNSNTIITRAEDEKPLSQISNSRRVLENDVPGNGNNSSIICGNVNKKTFKLCVSKNSEHVKFSLHDRPNRKRKRIVINKPIPSDVTGEIAVDMEGQSKYQKMDLNASRQTTYSNSDRKHSSFLECLDSC